MITRVLTFFHYALFAAVPVFLVLLFDGQLWPSFLPNAKPDPIGFVVAAIVMTLIASLFVFVVRLVLDESYREACLCGLAGVRERDEREADIVGRAARATFLLSLVMLVGLCLSNFFFLEIDPPMGEVNFLIGQRRAALVENSMVHGTKQTFDLMPLSKTGVMVFLFAFQVGAFRYFSRRTAGPR